MEIDPVVKQMYVKANIVIEKKISHAIAKGYIDAKDEKNITKLCETILNEFLHEPTKQLKTISKSLESDAVLTSIQNIFALDSKNNKNNKK